jgi:hypothetical protein
VVSCHKIAKAWWCEGRNGRIDCDKTTTHCHEPRQEKIARTHYIRSVSIRDMVKLEDIKIDAQVRGMQGDEVVRIIQVALIGEWESRKADRSIFQNEPLA